MTGNLFSDGNMPTTPGENENMQVISAAAAVRWREDKWGYK